MLIDAKELFKKLDELERVRLDQHLTLVLEDAPKNKFTLITGEVRMIREIRDELGTLIKTA